MLMPSQNTYTRHDAALRLTELAEQKEYHARGNRKDLAREALEDSAGWLVRSVVAIGALEVEAAQYRQFGDLLVEGSPVSLLIREAAKQAATGSGHSDEPGARQGLARAASEIIDVLTRIDEATR